MKKIALLFLIPWLASSLYAQTVNEERTAHHFELIKNNPQKLLSFLKDKLLSANHNK